MRLIALLLCWAAGASAAPHSAGDGPSVLVLPPKVVNSSSKSAALLDRLLMAALAERGAVVMGQGDLERLAELASAQQVGDCSSAACVAEIADALDAEYVVFGEVVRTGRGYLWQASMWHQRSGAVAARVAVEADAVDDLDVDAVADACADALGLARPGPAPLLVAGGVTAGIGAVTVVGAGVGLGVAAAVLADATKETSARQAAKDAAVPLLAVGGVGAGVALVGAVLLGVSLVGE